MGNFGGEFDKVGSPFGAWGAPKAVGKRAGERERGQLRRNTSWSGIKSNKTK